MKNAILFVCLAVASVLATEMKGYSSMTHLEYLYSQKVSIRDESDLKFVVERTDRVVVLQVPFLDNIGVRAYIPKEKMDKVKELLLSFKKTGSKKPSISPEEDVKFVNDFVCSMQFFDRKGLVIGVLGYYYPNQLITEDRTIWSSPRYKELDAILKDLWLFVPPVVGFD